MNARMIEKIIATWMRGSNRKLTLQGEVELHQSFRGYLGMSQIGQCPRKGYFSVVEPEQPDDSLYWYGYVGYGHEMLFRSLLMACGFAVVDKLDSRYEAIADFDPRYRGHFDNIITGWRVPGFFPINFDGGVTLPSWQNEPFLIEVKSMNWEKFQYLDRPKDEHYDQFQAYMKHSNYQRCVVVYICRDIPYREWSKTRPEDGLYLPFKFYDVFQNPERQEELDDKARMILRMVDDETPPKCECGWCRR